MEIVLYWRYLSHDIDQWTWRLGNMRKADPDQRFQSQSDEREEDLSFIRRNVEEGLSALRLIFADRLEDGVDGSCDDTLDQDTESWSIHLKGGGRHMDTGDLTALCHKYVVWYALWNWSLIYFEEIAAKLEEKLSGIAANIEDTAYRLKAPKKFKRKPYKDIDEVIVDEVSVSLEGDI